MDIQAAIGIHRSFQRIEPYWFRRQEIWRQYSEALADLPITLPSDPAPQTRHAYHLYAVLIDPETCGMTRDAFIDAMTAKQIGIGVHYRSIPEHGFYQTTFGWRPEDFPHAARIGRQTVSLPLSPALSEADVERVIAAVHASIIE